MRMKEYSRVEIREEETMCTYRKMRDTVTEI